MRKSDIADQRIRILTPSLEDGIGMSATYRALMLSSVCDVQVGVLYLKGDRNKNHLEQAGVTVVDLKARHGMDPASVLRALRWARTSGVDVVQAEQASAYPHAWLISRLQGTALVVWLNTPISPFEGPNWRIRWASRFLFPRADRIVCNSQHTRRRLLNCYPALEERSSVLYYPVASRHFVPSASRLPCRVGVVTTMIPVKKLERLLHAWPEIMGRFPQASLDIYGDGPERPRWEALAHKLELGPKVTFHGFVSDVAQALTNIGIFVLPTEGEAFGQVFVEAMLMERPCVAVRSGGVPEVVADGKTGILIPPGNEMKPLAEAIIHLLENPEQADVMGQAGRERALANFSPKTVSPKYVAFYHRLVEFHL